MRGSSFDLRNCHNQKKIGSRMTEVRLRRYTKQGIWNMGHKLRCQDIRFPQLEKSQLPREWVSWSLVTALPNEDDAWPGRLVLGIGEPRKV